MFVRLEVRHINALVECVRRYQGSVADRANDIDCDVLLCLLQSRSHLNEYLVDSCIGHLEDQCAFAGAGSLEEFLGIVEAEDDAPTGWESVGTDHD